MLNHSLTILHRFGLSIFPAYRRPSPLLLFAGMVGGAVFWAAATGPDAASAAQLLPSLESAADSGTGASSHWRRSPVLMTEGPTGAKLKQWHMASDYRGVLPGQYEMVAENLMLLEGLMKTFAPGHWLPSSWGLQLGSVAAALLLSFGALLTATRPVTAIFSFLGLLLSLLPPFFTLGADYVGAIHLMIYPGAILIFFSFATLTTDQRGHWGQWNRSSGSGGSGEPTLTRPWLRQLGVELRLLLVALPLLTLWLTILKPRISGSPLGRSVMPHSPYEFSYTDLPTELMRSTDLVVLGMEIFQRRLLSLSLLGLLLLLAFLTALELLSPPRRRRSSSLFPRLGAALPLLPVEEHPEDWDCLLTVFHHRSGDGWLLLLLPLLALGLGALAQRRYAFLHSFLLLEALGLLLNLFFVAVGTAADDLGGMVLVLFSVAVAAAETAVGLALFLALSQGSGLPSPPEAAKALRPRLLRPRPAPTSSTLPTLSPTPTRPQRRTLSGAPNGQPSRRMLHNFFRLTSAATGISTQPARPVHRSQRSASTFGPTPATSPAAALLVNHGLSYPTPANLSYFWNFGSLSALCLGLQLLSGIFLAMHYTAALSLAFDSVEHIMRDVSGGWFIRYLHSNGASAFFGVVYLHMFRGLLYQSYRHPNRGVWLSGVALFVLMMATAFIGYVLPWGQMSFWGATVITNLFSVIPLVGPELVQWLWGGFAVGGATLSRFYSLHYLLPFLLVALALLHIFALHQQGSSNPLGGESRDIATFQLPLYPYFLVKDLLGALIFAALLGAFIFYAPNLLGHSDNYIEANSLVTPEHIVPEWYFLPFYAILRSIPNKTLGILAMGGALLLLALLPLEGWLRRWGGLHSSQWVNFGEGPLSHRSGQRRHMLLVNLLGAVFLLLGFVGSRPVAEPYVSAGLALTVAYFLLLALLPLGGLRFWSAGPGRGDYSRALNYLHKRPWWWGW